MELLYQLSMLFRCTTVTAVQLDSGNFEIGECQTWSRKVMIVDKDIECFSGKHILLAILPLLAVIVFNYLLPALLLVL